MKIKQATTVNTQYDRCSNCLILKLTKKNPKNKKPKKQTKIYTYIFIILIDTCNIK